MGNTSTTFLINYHCSCTAKYQCKSSDKFANRFFYHAKCFRIGGEKYYEQQSGPQQLFFFSIGFPPKTVILLMPVPEFLNVVICSPDKYWLKISSGIIMALSF